MMHIAYIIDQYPKVSEQFIEREITALRELGVHISVFSMHRPKGSEVPEDTIYFSLGKATQGFLRNPIRSVLALIKGVFQSLCSLSGEPIRAVFAALALAACENEMSPWHHVHGCFANTPASVAMMYARLRGCSWSYSGHARDVLIRPLQLRRKIAEAGRVCACTEFILDVLKKYATPEDQDKVRLVRHGLPDELLNRLAGREADDQQGPRRLLAVGRLVRKKGYDVLVEAVNLLLQDHVEVTCTIVGDGPERDLLDDLIKKRHLDEVVTITGEVLPEEVAEHYLRSDVFLMPSVVDEDGDRDGLPNALLEAAAARLPIVSTAVGGIGEFVCSNETGLIVTPKDAQGLADAIERLIGDRDLCLRLGENARRDVEKRFRVKDNAQRLAEACGWISFDSDR